MELHELRTEQELERLGKTVSKLADFPVEVSVESYVDEDDAPLQDVTISIRKLPMTKANGELLEVLRDFVAAMEEQEILKERRRIAKLEQARLETAERKSGERKRS